MADEETRDEIERLRERAAFYELEARFATSEPETAAANAKAARLNALIGELSAAALTPAGRIPADSDDGDPTRAPDAPAPRRPRRARPPRS